MINSCSSQGKRRGKGVKAYNAVLGGFIFLVSTVIVDGNLFSPSRTFNPSGKGQQQEEFVPPQVNVRALMQVGGYRAAVVDLPPEVPFPKRTVYFKPGDQVGDLKLEAIEGNKLTFSFKGKAFQVIFRGSSPVGVKSPSPLGTGSGASVLAPAFREPKFPLPSQPRRPLPF